MMTSGIVDTRSYGSGRRKTAVARVWVSKGTGKFILKINNGNIDRAVRSFSDIKQYFSSDALVDVVLQPFKKCDVEGMFDVYATVKGSGKSAQSGALLLGISKALVEYYSEQGEAGMEMVLILRKAGLLTRDARKVERKKYGFKKARKSFQFSKR